MKLNLITVNSFRTSTSLTLSNPIQFLSPRASNPLPNHTFSLTPHSSKPSRFLPVCLSNPTKQSNSNAIDEISSDSRAIDSSGNSNEEEFERSLNMQMGNPVVPSFIQPSNKLSLNDQAFFLLSFIACTTSIAFTSLVIAAIPTLHAMGRAATSLSKLADTAREELPSTMAAIRLSGMEISDLTLELSDLSHEIADGVNKSAQAVQAAEAGIRQIGTLAHQHTMSMIQERASLPIISLQPVVAGAAKKTSRAVGEATKSFINMISRGEDSSENEDTDGIERLDI
ncbi:uncharacterized protein LOC8277125 [Ricinus communis]|uniref:Uncharacterized protein n=1 Tax=Ricinus communis TaxID=3988 RepID=B9SHK7_RICCO|nr:uncharacterized protein LOC8277125 [Ricinus communis]EEF36966.1 conserved hypothetical protein [Ricinus communis]|eukprot:XP_002525476.1 uncharacterized protein LOC8277125 [Ricinus communis]